MGYTISKNQSGVKKGYVKYRFDIYHPLTGKRERKQIICQKSIVDTLYRHWERQLLEESSSKFLLFEKLDEYLEYCIVKKTTKEFNAEKSLIENVIKKFFKQNTLIKDINRGHVEDFIVWRKNFVTSPIYSHSRKKGSVSDSTINRNLAILQFIFNYFIKKQYCTINPFVMSKLRVNNYREVNLNRDQIKELLEKAKELNLMCHNVICLLLLTGMRKGELFSLTWSEVDFENSVIWLSAYKTKGKKRRRIPLTPTLKEILLTLMDYSSELVISNYTFDMFKKHWTKLLKKIYFGTISDGSSLRIHDLRHIYAQSLSYEGVPMEDIQALLGHQDISTTQRRYAMFARHDLLEKASKIDKIIQ
jgi:integrase